MNVCGDCHALAGHCAYCIRGCRQPCRCTECRTAEQPAHDPRPKRAVDGRLCKGCADRLWAWLDAILGDTLTLDTRIPTDYGYERSEKHSKVSGSPALIRCDTAALTDPRTLADTPNDPLYIPRNTMGWAGLLAEEHGLVSPTDTMEQAVGLLTTWWTTVTASLWISEFYDDMHSIRRLLDIAHDVPRPKPIGTCFTCSHVLYSNPTLSGRPGPIRCAQCGRKYEGLDWVRLEVQRRRETEAQAYTSGQGAT